jgi:ABC-type multidrug transport system ATPase subunit
VANFTADPSSSQDTYKTVLDNVNGSLRSGRLTAIMGPTGSGKSSLLNVLAGRVLYVKNGALTGALLTNGQPRDQGRFKRISAYVLQDDVLYGFMTVRETLLLAAHFNLGPQATYAEKEAVVASIIKDLGLAKTVNTIIGNEFARGVSGGERKRVSIGVELICNPSMLFLGEPTTRWF